MKANAHKFKDGDRVRYVTELDPFGGTIGTVVTTGSEPDGLCKVRSDRDGETWWAHEYNLVLVENDEEDPRGTHIVIDIGENSGSARYMKGTKVIRSFETAGNIRGETGDEFDIVMALIKNLFPNGRLRMVSDCAEEEADDEEEEIKIPGFIEVYSNDDDDSTYIRAENISYIQRYFDEFGDEYTEIGTCSGDVFRHPDPIEEFVDLMMEALDE